MTSKINNLNSEDLLALLGGDNWLEKRLAAGERFRVETPFKYPGRQGAVVISLGPVPEPEPEPESEETDAAAEDSAETVLAEADAAERPSTRGKKPPPAPPPEDAIRITDTGGLLKYLPEHGMELEVDMVMSRTVFHAVRQYEGGGISHGQVYLDSTAGKVGEDMWHFLQLVGEIIGLRHAKYKDALVQLERRRETEQGVSKWRPT